MAISLGIVNDMLAEALRSKLGRYKPQDIFVGAVYLPNFGKYLIETNVDKGRRRFVSFYESDNPEEFLRTQELLFSEMFGCSIHAYLNGDEVEWTS